MYGPSALTYHFGSAQIRKGSLNGGCWKKIGATHIRNTAYRPADNDMVKHFQCHNSRWSETSPGLLGIYTTWKEDLPEKFLDTLDHNEEICTSDFANELRQSFKMLHAMGVEKSVRVIGVWMVWRRTSTTPHQIDVCILNTRILLRRRRGTFSKRHSEINALKETRWSDDKSCNLYIVYAIKMAINSSSLLASTPNTPSALTTLKVTVKQRFISRLHPPRR